jgi:hypothetical protein
MSLFSYLGWPLRKKLTNLIDMHYTKSIKKITKGGITNLF